MKVCVGIRTEKPTAQVLSAHVWHGQMMIAKLVSGDSQAPQCPAMLRNGIQHIHFVPCIMYMMYQAWP